MLDFLSLKKNQFSKYLFQFCSLSKWNFITENFISMLKRTNSCSRYNSVKFHKLKDR